MIESIERRTEVATPQAVQPYRALFFLHSLGYLRFFGPVIRALLDRGHAVDLIVERDFGRAREQQWLAETRRTGRFTFEVTDAMMRGRWSAIGIFLRRASDYLYFGSAAFEQTPFLTERAERRAPRLVRRLRRWGVWEADWVRRAVWWMLTRLEDALPVSRDLRAEIANRHADVFVMSPHLMPGSRNSEYLRAARLEALRTCVCIASWDNLSSKQQLRVVPDRLVVWNTVQKREAETLHGMPSECIEVTGAQSFDIWFDWQPRTREEFCRRVDLDPARRYVLYVGGALVPAAMTEAEFVHDVWIPTLRRDSRFRDVQFLLRPHPYRAAEWAAVDFGDRERVSVWPNNEREMPVDRDSQADYYDSIHHSLAVVGINTSAMIESAVVGRIVHTILVPEFANSQTGTFHFDYLCRASDGLLRVAGSYDEHREQLAEVLGGQSEEAEHRRVEFLRSFVRPQGLETPALPGVVAAVEAVAGLGHVEPPRLRPGLWPFRALAVLAFLLVTASESARRALRVVRGKRRRAFRPRRLLRKLRKEVRGALRMQRGRRIARRILRSLRMGARRAAWLRRSVARRARRLRERYPVDPF